MGVLTLAGAGAAGTGAGAVALFWAGAAAVAELEAAEPEGADLLLPPRLPPTPAGLPVCGRGGRSGVGGEVVGQGWSVRSAGYYSGLLAAA